MNHVIVVPPAEHNSTQPHKQVALVLTHQTGRDAVQFIHNHGLWDEYRATCPGGTAAWALCFVNKKKQEAVARKLEASTHHSPGSRRKKKQRAEKSRGRPVPHGRIRPFEQAPGAGIKGEPDDAVLDELPNTWPRSRLATKCTRAPRSRLAKKSTAWPELQYSAEYIAKSVIPFAESELSRIPRHLRESVLRRNTQLTLARERLRWSEEGRKKDAEDRAAGRPHGGVTEPEPEPEAHSTCEPCAQPRTHARTLARSLARTHAKQK